MRIREVHRGLWVAFIYKYTHIYMMSCCGDICSHSQHCWEMTVLNQRYNCYDFVAHDGGSEHPRGTIIACFCIRNQWTVSDPTVTEETGEKKILHSICGLWTKSGVCKSRCLLKHESPALQGAGFSEVEGKSYKWALKGESLWWNFDWMRCQKHSLAAKHSMKEHWKLINYITVMHL